jgi:hypothetical protein
LGEVDKLPVLLGIYDSVDSVDDSSLDILASSDIVAVEEMVDLDWTFNGF